ncbi:hypothetical protein DPMN_081460 [Dreissena polymorpha]|uniref:Reelin domain-containing protein n=1 Tax=Dreissena polymorpha TaxID=45954 RepID=A0A9D3Y7C1_DREPO|nr:hypothetical protein DPMN_081460 [Dreissena polymorpha]
MPPLLGVCLALLSVATPLVWGYSSGCPSSARVCSSMLPGHGAPAKTTPMRYSLTVDGGTSIYTPGLPVTLTLSGGPFVGFVVRALTGTGNGVSGMNSMSPNVITKDCGPVKDTVTHSSGAEKTTVMFQFTPPVGTSGTIEFHVTVVQDYDIYWVKQRGLTLTPTEAGSGSITTKQPPVSVPQTTGVSSTTKVQPVSLPQTTVVSQTTQQKPVSLPQTTVVSPTDITTLTPSTSSSSTSSSTSEVTSKTVVNVSAPTARAHIPALTIAPSAIGSVPNAHNISLAPNIATASSLRLNDSNSVGNAKLQVLPTDTPPIPGRNVKAVDPLIKQIDNMSKAKKDNVVDKTKSGISVIGAKKGTEVEKKTGGTNAKTRPEHVVPVSNIYSSALTIELGSSAATPTSDLTPKNSGDFNPNGFKGNVQSVVPIDADATGAIQPSNRDIIVEPVKSIIPEKIDSVNDIANVGNVDAIVSENQVNSKNGDWVERIGNRSCEAGLYDRIY